MILCATYAFHRQRSSPTPRFKVLLLLYETSTIIQFCDAAQGLSLDGLVVLCDRNRFALLGIEHMVIGDKPWLIGVRFVIAAGFGFLGWMELQLDIRNGNR